MIPHYRPARTYSPQTQHHLATRQHIAPLPDPHRRKFFELHYLCHEPQMPRPKEVVKRNRRDQLAAHHSRTLEIATINLCPDPATQLAHPDSLRHPQKIHSRGSQTSDSPRAVAAKRQAIHSSKCERRMRPNSSLSDTGILDFPSKQDIRSRVKAQF